MIEATAGSHFCRELDALGPPRLVTNVKRQPYMRTPFLQPILAAMFAVAAVQGADSPLSVTVSVPTRDGDRWLLLHEKSAHFHVIVSNTSGKPQRIWKERCSWGYYSLTFELTDDAGKKSVAKKKPASFSKNSPDWWSLEPGESLVLDVYFSDPEIWEGFPRPVNSSRIVTLRAIFEIEPDKFSTEHSIWTGRISSDPKVLTFYHFGQ